MIAARNWIVHFFVSNSYEYGILKNHSLQKLSEVEYINILKIIYHFTKTTRKF